MTDDSKQAPPKPPPEPVLPNPGEFEKRGQKPPPPRPSR